MLKIFYGEMKDVAYGPSWFKYGYELSWFNDPFVCEMLLDVDKTTYKTGGVFNSQTLGAIPPEKLSGGLQTLIMIYEMPEKVFDATSCGPNCAKWLVEIGKKKDVTINLRYFIPFDGLEPFEVEIINASYKATDAVNFALTSLDYID